MSELQEAAPTAVRTPRQGDENVPVYAVWEVTLRCDHACAHCGSRAVRPREDELSTAELLGVADQLLRLGTREVTLIGGEAYLRSDLPVLIRHLTDGGARVTMQTGGRGLTPTRCQILHEAGLKAVGVSLDGPPEAHDVLRDSPGSHAAGVRALRAAREAGLATASNMQVNRLTLPHLRTQYELMQSLGVLAWRTQVTVPMGRAADRPEWLLEPWQILEVLDTMAELQADAYRRAEAQGLPRHRALNVQAGNNIGYFGPHEALLRSRPGARPTYYQGCVSGRFTIGIESDGTIKGCPSLPTAPYAGGNVRELSLERIWYEAPELNFVQQRTTDELWGFCATCYYKDVCRGGCSWSSHCTLGRRGNQPWCYHRAATLKGRGIRERLVKVQAAEGLPYDFGRFELVEEPWPEDPAAGRG